MYFGKIGYWVTVWLKLMILLHKSRNLGGYFGVLMVTIMVFFA